MEKEKYCMTSFICEIYKEMMQMNLQNRKRLRGNELMVPGAGWRVERDREFGMDKSTMLYLKWITSKDLLYSARNSAQCYVSVI